MASKNGSKGKVEANNDKDVNSSHPNLSGKTECATTDPYLRYPNPILLRKIGLL